MWGGMGSGVKRLVLALIIWLVPRAEKMRRILCSDWLPTCPIGIARFVLTKAKFFGVIFWLFNKSFIGQACLVKMAGYWLVPFCIFVDLEFILVGHENVKKKLGNIQPS